MWNTFILEPMINALILIYQFLGQNFGLAILLFTALVRLITLPLTYQQMRSTMVMSEIQGSDRYKKMQEKYKNDKQKLSEEQMKLFREVGYNPFSGCLGLIIQFPIIIGLYQAIIRAIAATPAQLFDLYPRKGVILPGADADITIYDPRGAGQVDSTRWFSKAKSIERLYHGRPIQGKVHTTIVNGTIVYADGQITAEPGTGRFVRP